VSEEEEGGDAQEVTEEEMKSGNKAEVPPILLQNGAGGAGGAWGETVQRWSDALNKLGLGGGAPAPTAPDAEAGAEDGGEAGADG
jgi:hypothetical protein